MNLLNPLADSGGADVEDRALVVRAQGGDRAAIEGLVRRRQRWIYNLAIRMLYHPQDAEHATQEILITPPRRRPCSSSSPCSARSAVSCSWRSARRSPRPRPPPRAASSWAATARPSILVSRSAPSPSGPSLPTADTRLASAQVVQPARWARSRPRSCGTPRRLALARRVSGTDHDRGINHVLASGHKRVSSAARCGLDQLRDGAARAELGIIRMGGDHQRPVGRFGHGRASAH
jgi:hypothetical protein